MVKYFDDGAHGNRIYYSAEGYFKPCCPFLPDKYVSRTRQSYRLYPLPFEEMESSSQKLSETSKKVIDDLLSTYERARGIVNSVCLRVFFPNFSSANRVYVLLTASKNWIEYDMARKRRLQKKNYDLLMLV